MIYDFRMYTLKPGATPDYRAGVKEVGLPIRQNHDVALSGWYWSDVGALYQGSTSGVTRTLSTCSPRGGGLRRPGLGRQIRPPRTAAG